MALINILTLWEIGQINYNFHYFPIFHPVFVNKGLILNTLHFLGDFSGVIYYTHTLPRYMKNLNIIFVKLIHYRSRKNRLALINILTLREIGQINYNFHYFPIFHPDFFNKGLNLNTLNFYGDFPGVIFYTHTLPRYMKNWKTCDFPQPWQIFRVISQTYDKIPPKQ